MYKFIVLATIVAVACALPTPKPDAATFQHYPAVGHHQAYVAEHPQTYVTGQHQAYVAGQPQAYVSGHNQVYVGGPHEYSGTQQGVWWIHTKPHGGYPKSYGVNSGYASPYYDAGYTPLVSSHSSPVVYNY